MTPLGYNSINNHGSELRSRKRRRSKIDLSVLLSSHDSCHSLLSTILDVTDGMFEVSGTDLDQGNTRVIYHTFSFYTEYN